MTRTLLQIAFGIALVLALAAGVHVVLEKRRLSQLPAGRQIIRPPHEVSALVLHRGLVFAGGQDGLTAIDPATRTARALPAGAPTFSHVFALTVDGRGVLWVGHDGGMASLHEGGWRDWTGWLPDGDRRVRAILEDRTGLFWIGTDHSLLQARSSPLEIAPPPLPVQALSDQGLRSADVLLEDREGHLWVGSSSSSSAEASLFRADGPQWIRMGADHLAHPMVNALIQDRSGGIWVGTGFANRGGASRWKGGIWTSWTTSDGLAGEKVRCVFEDRQRRLWFGSEYDGVAVTDGRTWTRLALADGLAGREVKVIIQDESDDYWLGTDSGLSWIDRASLPVSKAP